LARMAKATFACHLHSQNKSYSKRSLASIDCSDSMTNYFRLYSYFLLPDG